MSCTKHPGAGFVDENDIPRPVVDKHGVGRTLGQAAVQGFARTRHFELTASPPKLLLKRILTVAKRSGVVCQSFSGHI